MARLLTCPDCRRHVRAWEQDCPFCGHVGLTTSATGRLSTLLLGLCLVGCTSSTDDGKKAAPEKAPINVPPEPEPAPTTAVTPEPVAPTTAVPPEPELPPEPASTTAIEPPPVEGTDAGSKIDDPPPEVATDPEPKVKYGGPRPQKKYGAPPKPPEEPGF
jgi:hypothetical protein